MKNISFEFVQQKRLTTLCFRFQISLRCVFFLVIEQQSKQLPAQTEGTSIRIVQDI